MRERCPTLGFSNQISCDAVDMEVRNYMIAADES